MDVCVGGEVEMRVHNEDTRGGAGMKQYFHSVLLYGGGS